MPLVNAGCFPGCLCRLQDDLRCHDDFCRGEQNDSGFREPDENCRVQDFLLGSDKKSLPGAILSRQASLG
jgi:hypothetical protein